LAATEFNKIFSGRQPREGVKRWQTSTHIDVAVCPRRSDWTI